MFISICRVDLMSFTSDGLKLEDLPDYTEEGPSLSPAQLSVEPEPESESLPKEPPNPITRSEPLLPEKEPAAKWVSPVREKAT